MKSRRSCPCEPPGPIPPPLSYSRTSLDVISCPPRLQDPLHAKVFMSCVPVARHHTAGKRSVAGLKPRIAHAAVVARGVAGRGPHTTVPSSGVVLVLRAAADIARRCTGAPPTSPSQTCAPSVHTPVSSLDPVGRNPILFSNVLALLQSTMHRRTSRRWINRRLDGASCQCLLS
jgi:hypothetical protein